MVDTCFATHSAAVVASREGTDACRRCVVDSGCRLGIAAPHSAVSAVVAIEGAAVVRMLGMEVAHLTWGTEEPEKQRVILGTLAAGVVLGQVLPLVPEAVVTLLRLGCNTPPPPFRSCFLSRHALLDVSGESSPRRDDVSGVVATYIEDARR